MSSLSSPPSANNSASQPHSSNPKPQATRPLPLPFSKRRKMGLGEWVFKHRVGLLVTIIFQLTLAILFLTYQIIIRPVSANNLQIDMVNENLEVPQQQEAPPEKELQNLENVRIENKISNESSKLDASLRDDRNTKTNASQLLEDAQRVQAELEAGNEAYKKGMSELEAMEKGGKSHSSMLKSSKGNQQEDKQQGKDQRSERARYQGNVTVSYYLPGRTDTHLYIPAYRCEGGGQVVVNITVNQNGKVVSASIEKATSTSDNCVLEMAVQAAKATTFNVSSSAPDRQKGTITYIFIPQ